MGDVIPFKGERSTTLLKLSSKIHLDRIVRVSSIAGTEPSRHPKRDGLIYCHSIRSEDACLSVVGEKDTLVATFINLACMNPFLGRKRPLLGGGGYALVLLLRHTGQA